MAFVVDNSVVGGWFIANQSTDYTEAIALRYDLTSHDAAYLELALRLQLPIATRDAALIEAARAAGVGVLKG